MTLIANLQIKIKSKIHQKMPRIVFFDFGYDMSPLSVIEIALF
jgi:hypothetical protein